MDFWIVVEGPRGSRFAGRIGVDGEWRAHSTSSLAFINLAYHQIALWPSEPTV